MKKPSLILIACYFGKFPWYFDYFIHSCEKNREVHFLLVTDNQSYEGKLPQNIIPVYQSFISLKERISNSVNMSVQLLDAYKLCDFRPAFGLIFEDHLKGYAFWGHCDIDVLFGNISLFITKDILSCFDIISIRPEYISGFFALYRNSKFVNSLFKKSKSYRSVFSDSRYMGFDECGLQCDKLLEGKNLNELHSEIESMTHLAKRFASEKKINTYFDLHAIESVPGNLRWSNGQLIYKSKYEILLYHLISFKAHPKLVVPKWKGIPSQFSINQFSFSNR